MPARTAAPCSELAAYIRHARTRVFPCPHTLADNIFFMGTRDTSAKASTQNVLVVVAIHPLSPCGSTGTSQKKPLSPVDKDPPVSRPSFAKYDIQPAASSTTAVSSSLQTMWGRAQSPYITVVDNETGRPVLDGDADIFGHSMAHEILREHKVVAPAQRYHKMERQHVCGKAKKRDVFPYFCRRFFLCQCCFQIFRSKASGFSVTAQHFEYLV